MTLAALESGGGLLIKGKSENELLEVTSSKILMYDGNGKPAVGIATGEGGGGMLNVFNALGNIAGSLQSNKSNDGVLYLTDSTGTQKNSVGPQR